MPIAVTSVHHITLPVADLERSRRFYEGVLRRRHQKGAARDVVALSERDDRRREEAAGALGAAAHRDLEPFLDHRDMDAVLLVRQPARHSM